MIKTIDDLEFRLNDDSRNPEIRRNYTVNGKSSCYTILWWIKGSEGYSIEFIGARPFDREVNQQALWSLMKFGQTICDASYEIDNP